MRMIAICLAGALTLTACGSSDPAVRAGQETPEIMTVALVQLVTEDNTFGDGTPPFTEYLIQTHTDPRAGDPTGSPEAAGRQLTEAERAAIEEAISGYGPVRWIEDPDEWRTYDLVPEVEGSVILGVGDPDIDGETALVPVSLWCAGLCGTWFSYRVDLVDGAWAVSGIEGPVAIS